MSGLRFESMADMPPRTACCTRISAPRNRQSAGDHILSDLCRRRSAMRRLREETPALHPAHGKSLKHVRRESA
jgi:hypothetical protein